MQRTSTVVWTIVGAVLAALAVLALIYGPGLYREGKALVEPIVELSRSEDRLGALNDELPFTPPADGAIAEDRLEVFLDVRRDLVPHYREWDRLERRLSSAGEEDWDTAKEVLAAVRTVSRAQLEVLRSHGMSPAEFNWIEDLVYATWLGAVDETAVRDEVVEALRSTAAGDLEFIAELERRYGSSPATRRIEDRLEARIAELDAPELPPVDGVPAETSRMLWRNREEIVELAAVSDAELHDMLRGGDVNVELGSE